MEFIFHTQVHSLETFMPIHTLAMQWRKVKRLFLFYLLIYYHYIFLPPINYITFSLLPVSFMYKVSTICLYSLPLKRPTTTSFPYHPIWLFPISLSFNCDYCYTKRKAIILYFNAWLYVWDRRRKLLIYCFQYLYW